MDSLSGGDTSNNPRIDLLHGSGDNQQVAGAQAGGMPMPVMGAVPTGVMPAAAPAPAVTTIAPSEPSLMGMAAKPKAQPAAAPAPEVIPEPRPAPPPPGPVGPTGHSRWPIVIGVIVALLLLAGIAVVWWWLTMREEETPAPAVSIEVEATAPVDLAQVAAGGDTIAKGKATKQTKLTFRWTVATSANTGSLTPELELRPLAEGFTGEATAIGDDLSASGSDMQFSIESEGLVEGAYHWQARVKKGDQASEWVAYGGDAAATAFVVDTTAPAAPTVETVASQKAAGSATVTTNRPTIAGKTDPNAVVTVTVSPENLSFNTTSDATGAWSLQPDRDIPNGQHQLSLTVADEAGNTSTAAALTLAVNPATTADATPAGSGAATPTPTPTPAAATPTPAPATVSTTLAPTGDNPLIISLASGLALLVTGAGLIWLRRRHAHA